jgi:hypothetical protein
VFQRPICEGTIVDRNGFSMQKSDDEIPFLIHHDDLIVEAYLLK